MLTVSRIVWWPEYLATRTRFNWNQSLICSTKRLLYCIDVSELQFYSLCSQVTSRKSKCSSGSKAGETSISHKWGGNRTSPICSRLTPEPEVRQRWRRPASGTDSNTRCIFLDCRCEHCQSLTTSIARVAGSWYASRGSFQRAQRAECRAPFFDARRTVNAWVHEPSSGQWIGGAIFVASNTHSFSSTSNTDCDAFLIRLLSNWRPRRNCRYTSTLCESGPALLTLQTERADSTQLQLELPPLSWEIGSLEVGSHKVFARPPERWQSSVSRVPMAPVDREMCPIYCALRCGYFTGPAAT